MERYAGSVWRSTITVMQLATLDFWSEVGLQRRCRCFFLGGQDGRRGSFSGNAEAPNQATNLVRCAVAVPVVVIVVVVVVVVVIVIVIITR